MLILRLQHPDDSEPAWAVLNGTSAEWMHGSWEKLLPLTQGQQLVLLIPGREVLLTHTTINTRNQRQLQQAVPFALEDALADDTENLHTVWQIRRDSNQIDAAIIERERLRHWITALQRRKLRAHAILPDVFALPYEPETLTLWQQGEHVWLRTGDLSGFTCHNATLPLMLEGLRASNTAPLRLRLYADQATPWAENTAFELIPELHPEQLLASSLQTAMPLNLLRGWQDENKAQLQQQLKRWRMAAILAGVTLSLGATWYGVNTYRLQQQLNQLDASNQQLFGELFPETGEIDPRGLKGRLESELIALRKNAGQTGATDPLQPLATFAAAFTNSPGLNVEEIRSNAGELVISLQTKDQQAIDTLRSNLETALGKAVELKSSRSADTIKANLTLGGAS